MKNTACCSLKHDRFIFLSSSIMVGNVGKTKKEMIKFGRNRKKKVRM